MAVHGETLLDNERICVRSIVAQPSTRLLLPQPVDGQLAVFIKGGILTSAAGRSTVWGAGRVAWLSGPHSILDGRVNSGPAAVELVHVSFKRSAGRSGAPPSANSSEDTYLRYPHIPGEDVFENEWVVVQRFNIAAGQWEGVHAHVPNMLYIHVVGGQWAARSAGEAERIHPGRSGDGTVGWMPTIDISKGHESGNVGDAPIDLIWVTLKG